MKAFSQSQELGRNVGSVMSLDFGPYFFVYFSMMYKCTMRKSVKFVLSFTAVVGWMVAHVYNRMQKNQESLEDIWFIALVRGSIDMFGWLYLVAYLVLIDMHN